MNPNAKRANEGSERTCIVTGWKGPPEAMLHFALSPSGEVAPDLKRKLPGRGVWTRLSRAAVAQAVRKQAFSRGFKEKALAAPVMTKPDLLTIDRNCKASRSMSRSTCSARSGAASALSLNCLLYTSDAADE